MALFKSAARSVVKEGDRPTLLAGRRFDVNDFLSKLA